MTSVTVIGAGIVGLWQAFELAQRGFAVRLRDALDEANVGAASRFAGAMLAPHCETEAAPEIVTQLGRRGLQLWQRHYPLVKRNGTLVLAAPGDQGELQEFARLTDNHSILDADAIGALEPDLAGRFDRALYFEGESHLAPRPAIAFLLNALREAGVTLSFNDSAKAFWTTSADEIIVDCRGLGAREDLPELRGVRGEIAVVRANDVALSRAVRLIHPRSPLYIVPWGENLYMLGATIVDHEDSRPVNIRSALNILGCAYHVHPGFGDAEVLELSSGMRPALENNIPTIAARGRRLVVNGAYRHGFLLAPALAELVADFLETGATVPTIFIDAN